VNEAEFYNPFEQMNLAPGACFLCGGVPDESTREHVFPMWLLQRQGLLNERLTLLNGTSIPYRQLTVPCCLECNSEHLAHLESAVERASLAGASAVRELPDEAVFQWMAKIFIGVLWAELRFKADRAEIDGGPIVPPEVLEEFSVLHGHLQSVRRPFVFHPPKPWSIFVSDLHTFEPSLDFDYCDSQFGLCFAIRFSGVGIIASLQDNSTQRDLYGHVWAPLEGVPLHWQQWDEMWVKVVYRASLLRRTPKYINVLPNSDGEPVQVMSLPTGGFAPEAMWEEWNQETYAEALLALLQRRMPWLSMKDIFQPPDKVMSWVFRPDGSVNALDPDGNPVG
jgi:hypothetical protein